MSHDDQNTAKLLGRFRKELVEEGFSEEAAQQLALDWGRHLAGGGGILRVGGA